MRGNSSREVKVPLSVRIPASLFNESTRRASQNRLSLTHYQRIGHAMLYDLYTGGFSDSTVVSMYGQKRSVPQMFGLLVTTDSSPTEEVHALNFNQTLKLAEETDELCRAIVPQSRVAYAGATLRLLNGVIALDEALRSQVAASGSRKALSSLPTELTFSFVNDHLLAPEPIANFRIPEISYHP